MANLEDLKPPSEEQRPAKGVVVYLSRSVTDLIDVLKIFEVRGYESRAWKHRLFIDVILRTEYYAPINVSPHPPSRGR